MGREENREKKERSLADRYRLTQKVLGIVLALIAVACFLAGVLLIFMYDEIAWLGWVFAVVGVVFALLYVGVREYIRKQIKEIEGEDVPEREFSQRPNIQRRHPEDADAGKEDKRDSAGKKRKK